MSSFVVDAFSFCQRRETRSGTLAVRESARLLAECANDCGQLAWRVEGGQHVRGHSQLEVFVQGRIQLVCQRCLTPVDLDIDTHSVLVLAKSEEEADTIEAELDDDAIDVVAGSKAFDLMQVIEDEVLLELPQSPKHAVCPDALSGAAPDSASQTSPFAVLKKN